MSDQPPDGRGAGVRGLAARFGHFWWDFLIGDTPELFVGAVAVVGLVALICLDHALRPAGAVVLPLLVAAVLAASVRRGARTGARRPPE